MNLLMSEWIVDQAIQVDITNEKKYIQAIFTSLTRFSSWQRIMLNRIHTRILKISISQ